MRYILPKVIQYLLILELKCLIIQTISFYLNNLIIFIHYLCNKKKNVNIIPKNIKDVDFMQSTIYFKKINIQGKISKLWQKKFKKKQTYLTAHIS